MKKGENKSIEHQKQNLRVQSLEKKKKVGEEKEERRTFLNVKGWKRLRMCLWRGSGVKRFAS